MGRLLLLDSASLYFRAFYGIPDSLKAPDGTVVNALRGILDFVSTLTTQYEPEAVVACWDDDWRPQWRVDLLPSYKTHRLADPGGGAGPGAVDDTAGGGAGPGAVDDTAGGGAGPGAADDTAEEVPDALGPQVPLIAEALDIVGIAVVGAEHAEADDIIGTLSGRWDGPVDIVTGDRDLFQLVDDDHPVRVLYVARGVNNHDVVDAAWLRAKYGIEPQQYADFATMRGDASDGIPGVAGIGEKTAATLLADHGDLESILAAAADTESAIKPRPRASLTEDPDLVRRMREVVGVRTDATDAQVTALPPLDDDRRERLEAFGEQWGLGGVVERLQKALPH